MKNLQRNFILGSVCIGMLLGLFVITSNAQYRGNRGWSVNISYGQPYYRPAPRYVYRRPRYTRPVRYYSYREYRRPVVAYPTRYYGNGYYVSRKKYRPYKKYKHRRYVYRNW